MPRRKRYGKPETWKTRLKRCERQVRRTNRSARRKVNEYAVCRATIPKFKGKKRRVLRGGG